VRRRAREGWLDAVCRPDSTSRVSFPDIILLQALARFNLGVVPDDSGRIHGAIIASSEAMGRDGDPTGAVRYVARSQALKDRGNHG